MGSSLKNNYYEDEGGDFPEDEVSEEECSDNNLDINRPESEDEMVPNPLLQFKQQLDEKINAIQKEYVDLILKSNKYNLGDKVSFILSIDSKKYDGFVLKVIFDESMHTYIYTIGIPQSVSDIYRFNVDTIIQKFKNYDILEKDIISLNEGFPLLHMKSQ